MPNPRGTITMDNVDLTLLKKQVGHLAEVDYYLRMKVLADPNTTHTVRHNATRWHDALTGIMNMLGDRVEVRR